MIAEDFLKPPAREAVEIKLRGRSEPAHVRVLLIREFDLLQKQMLEASDEDKLALQLAAFLSDKDGNALFDLQGVKAAAENLYPSDIKTILLKGVEINSVAEAALESTEKNS